MSSSDDPHDPPPHRARLPANAPSTAGLTDIKHAIGEIHVRRLGNDMPVVMFVSVPAPLLFLKDPADSLAHVHLRLLLAIPHDQMTAHRCDFSTAGRLGSWCSSPDPSRRRWCRINPLGAASRNAIDVLRLWQRGSVKTREARLCLAAS